MVDSIVDSPAGRIPDSAVALACQGAPTKRPIRVISESAEVRVFMSISQ